jgi:histidyl-tRNA synthetase
LQQLKVLRTTVANIVKELKKLKSEGKLNEITSICNQNDKLKQLSKILRQDYYKYLPELKDNLQSEFNEGQPLEQIKS